MDNLHQNLSERSVIYRKWNEMDSHNLIHWLVLILIVVTSWSLLLQGISLWEESVTEPGVYIHISRFSAVMTLYPQTKSVKVGETFNVNIVLDTANQPIDGVDIYGLHFDPNIIKVIDDVPSQSGVQIHPGDNMSVNVANTVNNKTGTIKFGQVSLGGTTFTGKGVLATIHFQGLKSGTTFLKFDFKKGDTRDTNAAHNGKDQLSHVIDAVYTVE